MAKKDLTSALPPKLISYEIPGQVLSAKALREADRKSRPPQAEYARGSQKDLAGNRGR